MKRSHLALDALGRGYLLAVLIGACTPSGADYGSSVSADTSASPDGSVDAGGALNADGSASADGSVNVDGLGCAELTLPKVTPYGYTNYNPTPPQAQSGITSGQAYERAPVAYSSGASASYATTSGLTVHGWYFTAQAGERFDFISQPLFGGGGGTQPLAAYGPINSCNAPATGAPASATELWTAPAAGTYFLAPVFGLNVDINGNVAVDFGNPEDDSENDSEYTFRQVLPDGTLAGHTLVQGPKWPLYGVIDARVAKLNGKDALIAYGQGEYSGANVNTLVVARLGQLDAAVQMSGCGSEPGRSDRLVVGDFNGDQQDDVLIGTMLFTGNADGTFGCEPSGFDGVLAAWPLLGAADMDGDGQLDLLTEYVQDATEPGVDVSTLSIQPFFRRGAAFVTGAVRQAPIPIDVGILPGNARVDLVDYGAGAKIVLGAFGQSATSSSAQGVYVFDLPVYGPADAQLGTMTAPALAPLTVAASSLPSIDALGDYGPRSVDVDGDGLPDLIDAGRLGFEDEGASLTYGKSGGGAFESLPWVFTSSTAGGVDYPPLMIADVDGDGCLDVVVASVELSVLRGIHCQQ
jgi:hypothetical protein